MKIKVTKLNEHKWQASINEGWWVALGKARDEAIKRVIKRYNVEMSILK